MCTRYYKNIVPHSTVDVKNDVLECGSCLHLLIVLQIWNICWIHLMQLMIFSLRKEPIHFLASWWMRRSVFYMDSTNCIFVVLKVYLLDVVPKKIRLASKCNFGKRGRMAHIMGGIHKSIVTMKWKSYAGCPRTIMSIMQHSILKQWMLALIGLTLMYYR